MILKFSLKIQHERQVLIAASTTMLFRSGVVKGNVEVKLGDSYDPIGHPCVSSSINPTLWKQRFRHDIDDDDALVIDFATPTAGSYLSVKTENIRAAQITICEIILRY